MVFVLSSQIFIAEFPIQICQWGGWGACPQIWSVFGLCLLIVMFYQRVGGKFLDMWPVGKTIVWTMVILFGIYEFLSSRAWCFSSVFWLRRAVLIPILLKMGLLYLQHGLWSRGDSHCINDGAVVLTTAAFCINKLLECLESHYYCINNSF